MISSADLDQRKGLACCSWKRCNCRLHPDTASQRQRQQEDRNIRIPEQDYVKYFIYNIPEGMVLI